VSRANRIPRPFLHLEREPTMIALSNFLLVFVLALRWATIFFEIGK
jgi:hypothetical protein